MRAGIRAAAVPVVVANKPEAQDALPHHAGGGCAAGEDFNHQRGFAATPCIPLRASQSDGKLAGWKSNLTVSEKPVMWLWMENTMPSGPTVPA